jgi:hypothetical protein
MKINLSLLIFNGKGTGSGTTTVDQKAACSVSRKVARRYGLCSETAALVARLADLGPREWR